MGVSVFKICSRTKGLGTVAMHGKGVRGGRVGRTPLFIIRLQPGEGPTTKGSLIAKTASSATGPVGSRGPHFSKGRAWSLLGCPWLAYRERWGWGLCRGKKRRKSNRMPTAGAKQKEWWLSHGR